MPDKIFSLSNYDGIIFDLDGTVYRGSHIVPGSDITINKLRRLNKKIAFVSNKTTGTAQEYYEFLSGHGIKLSLSEVFNATLIAGQYLEKNCSGAKFFAISEPTFVTEIEKYGLTFTDNPVNVDIVLVTLDRALTFPKLEIAAHSLELGAQFLAVNTDNTCPVDEGEIWDAGATLAALEKRTHRKPEIVFGKPSPLMMNTIFDFIKLPAEKLLLIGDRLETDIKMGNDFGIDTALVMTGVKNFINGNSDVKPTYVFNSINDLIS